MHSNSFYDFLEELSDDNDEESIGNESLIIDSLLIPKLNLEIDEVISKLMQPTNEQNIKATNSDDLKVSNCGETTRTLRERTRVPNYYSHKEDAVIFNPWSIKKSQIVDEKLEYDEFSSKTFQFKLKSKQTQLCGYSSQSELTFSQKGIVLDMLGELNSESYLLNFIIAIDDIKYCALIQYESFLALAVEIDSQVASMYQHELSNAELLEKKHRMTQKSQQTSTCLVAVIDQTTGESSEQIIKMLNTYFNNSGVRLDALKKTKSKQLFSKLFNKR